MLEAKNQLGTIILIFITIIIGVTLITALGDQIFENVNLRNTLNQTTDVSSARNVTGGFTSPTEFDLTDKEMSSFSELRMENGTAFTEDTDYRVNLTVGGITMLNSQLTDDFQDSNTTLADYSEYPDLYVKHSIARTIINNLILIFFVVGLVIWVYVKVKETWLDNIT